MCSIKRLAAAACLALLANSALAIPLTVEIQTAIFGGAGGEWDLDGPTPLHDNWSALFFGNYNQSFDIAPGDYTFSISGGGGGIGVISWTLTVGNTFIGPNHIGIFGFRLFNEGTAFGANATPLAEPGSFALLAMGLTLMGLWFVARCLQRRARTGNAEA